MQRELDWNDPNGLSALSMIYMQNDGTSSQIRHEHACAAAGAERNNDERHQRKGIGFSVACVQQGVPEQNLQRERSGKGS